MMESLLYLLCLAHIIVPAGIVYSALRRRAVRP